MGAPWVKRFKILHVLAVLAFMGVGTAVAIFSSRELKKISRENRLSASAVKYTIINVASIQHIYASKNKVFSASFKDLGIRGWPLRGWRYSLIGIPSACAKKWGISEKEAFYSNPNNLDKRFSKEILDVFETLVTPDQCPDLRSDFVLLGVAKIDENQPPKIFHLSKKDFEGSLEDIRKRLDSL